MKELPSCFAYTDPWKSDDNNVIYVTEVDLDSELNSKPKQDLEGDENIKVMMLPLDGFYDALKKVTAEKHCLMDSTVWMFALGMQFAKVIKPTKL